MVKIQKIIRLNVSEIKGIKLECKKCDSFFWIPIEKKNEDDIKKMCINCKNKIPWGDVAIFLTAIKALDRACKDSNADALIETEISD